MKTVSEGLAFAFMVCLLVLGVCVGTRQRDNLSFKQKGAGANQPMCAKSLRSCLAVMNLNLYLKLKDRAMSPAKDVY